MSGKVILTHDGYNKLVEELEYLKTTKRREVTDALATARAHGDLKENAEYHAAKEAKAHLETKIAQMENRLAQAQILDTTNIDKSKAYIGAMVEIENMTLEENFTYELVGEDEADFDAGRIAVTSPIGQGLLGKSVGEEVDLKVPAGIMKIKVLKIEYHL